MPVVAPIFGAIAAAGAGLAAAAPAIGAITGIASAGLAMDQGNRANKAAKNASSDAAANQSRLAKEIYDQKATADSNANAIATRDAARNRQKALAAGAQGRRSTILTSPLGTVNNTGTGLKTSLGS